MIRGTISKHEDLGWGITHEDKWYSLHPDDLNTFSDLEIQFDNFQTRVSKFPYVLFKIIKHQKMDGVVEYGKLLPTKYPCKFDHNGECLICDCSVDMCGYSRYIKGDFTYESEEDFEKMFGQDLW